QSNRSKEYAVHETLTEQRPRLKYLFISGNTSRLIADQGLAVDKHCYILKPDSSSALAQKIRECLAQV
ncbi:MAG: hypothetical protein KAI66_26615, partial [Lentisphaeria bacterium]|nr:hypothetical protein [Lentisphaeria bacterium]